MNTLPKISVCIIAKNEEKMLPDCLKSVQQIAHEIILVDTGSTDNTKNIAKNFNCKIYDFTWIDDFSAARNESLKHATGDFILYIDADERVLNASEIINAIQNSVPNIGGWFCQMISNANRQQNITTRNISTVIRLFKNNPQFRFKGIIHEQILNSIVQAGYKIAKSEIKFLHLGYDISETEMQKKHIRNLGLLEKWLEKNSNDIYSKTHKGKTLLALGKTNEAAEYFLSFVQNIDDNNPTKIDTLNNAAVAFFRNKNLEKALEFAKSSLKLNPNQAFGNFILGELFLQKNNFAEALGAYLKMQKAIENLDFLATVSGEFQLSPEQIHWRIGRALMGISDYNSAIYEFEKGLKISPNDAYCLIGIANVAFKLRKFSEAKNVLEIALKFNPEHSEIKNFIQQVDEFLARENESFSTVIASKAKQSTENTKEIATPTARNDGNCRGVLHTPTEQGRMQYAPTNKKLITVCMIVKNEEKMLAGCLETVKNIADEIIIVDTGSVDKTVEVAKKYNAKIFNFAWIDDFSAARNESLKHATSEWILYLDADERLTVSSQNQIRDLLLSTPEEVGGYFCTIESDHSKMDGSSEKHRGGYPRLFRNLGYPNINFVGRVHEQISPSIISNKKTILVSDIKIEHLGYNLSLEEMDKKVRRNYNMLLAHIKEEPTNGYAWFQLGQTLGQMGIAEEAENATRFAIQCGDLSGSVYASAAATLSQLSGRKKNFEEALHWANESLSKAPNQLFGLSLKAHSLLYLNRKKEAEEVFLQAIETVKRNPQMPRSGFDIDISEEVLLKGLAASRQ